MEEMVDLVAGELVHGHLVEEVAIQEVQENTPKVMLLRENLEVAEDPSTQVVIKTILQEQTKDMEK